MQSYTPGLAATVVFSLAVAGVALVPTALRSRITDEAETPLQDWAAIELTDPLPAEVAVTVIGVLNILTPPAVRGVRIVELEVTTASGTIILSESILLQGTTALALGSNTFQTYAQAELRSSEFGMATVQGWIDTPERILRESALIEAYGRISLLSIWIEYDNSQSIVRDIGNAPPRLSDLTAAQVLALDPKMLAALRSAQLLEAADILNTDPVREARRSGIVSMTVGESSQFFGTAKGLDEGVCSNAMKYLSRWLRTSAKIGRA